MYLTQRDGDAQGALGLGDLWFAEEVSVHCSGLLMEDVLEENIPEAYR